MKLRPACTARRSGSPSKRSQPLSFPARTPTMMLFALSALKVMLVVWMFVWSSTGPCQLPLSSSLYIAWYFVAPLTASHDAVTVPSARVTVMFGTLPGTPC